MAVVKYPYSVKFNGKRYAPNMPIEVADATEFVKNGAIVVDEKKKGGRKAKAEKTTESTEETKNTDAVKTAEEVKVSDETTESTEE